MAKPTGLALPAVLYVCVQGLQGGREGGRQRGRPALHSHIGAQATVT